MTNKTNIYDESIVIDGLNVSNWESPAVFDSLNNGNVTAINATIEDFGDSIEDMVERVGINHVAIGTDYTQDQPSEWFDTATSEQGTKPSDLRLQIPENPCHPKGLETPDKMSNISMELSKIGFTENNIEKILGGNWLSLMKNVWKLNSLHTAIIVCICKS